MATPTTPTQTRLIPQSFHLDARSRAAGREGLVKARAALADAKVRAEARAEVKARAAAADHGDLSRDHATAA